RTLTDIRVIPVQTVNEVLAEALLPPAQVSTPERYKARPQVLSAAPNIGRPVSC
ncbi:MAG: ATP-dependent Lon protease, partial [Moorella sp. (in: firmicutes)]|nr:ATP-dependent Lon protease [Moorella sp. (in: firmicutes)]